MPTTYADNTYRVALKRPGHAATRVRDVVASSNDGAWDVAQQAMRDYAGHIADGSLVVVTLLDHDGETWVYGWRRPEPPPSGLVRESEVGAVEVGEG